MIIAACLIIALRISTCCYFIACFMVVVIVVVRAVLYFCGRVATAIAILLLICLYIYKNTLFETECQFDGFIAENPHPILTIGQCSNE